ncbi:hypothetical protein B0J11DRAFT_152708 [Dendryphion nanum]|uniref:Uncharacterized protein n=1 Tax=Dendryphion nanum TaxID=256645 RepID=A0A9P9EC10_9PLEO|nr:hypothetical protein B0J11DRAFT_152708 [Dendryphion nanum]
MMTMDEAKQGKACSRARTRVLHRSVNGASNPVQRTRRVCLPTAQPWWQWAAHCTTHIDDGGGGLPTICTCIALRAFVHRNRTRESQSIGCETRCFLVSLRALLLWVPRRSCYSAFALFHTAMFLVCGPPVRCAAVRCGAMRLRYGATHLLARFPLFIFYTQGSAQSAAVPTAPNHGRASAGRNRGPQNDRNRRGGKSKKRNHT